MESCGFLNNYEDAVSHMRAADGFASSSAREGFRISFLEVMIAECTVIGGDHPESAVN
jgi:glycosyltransferase involved in cell wall biosynthesis